MDRTVYRVPTVAQLHTMVTTAGYIDIDHRTVPRAGHDLHLVIAHTPRTSRPSS
jgi:hypothetical protein